MIVSLVSRATDRTASSPRNPSRASSLVKRGSPNPICSTPPDCRDGTLARELEHVLSQRGALNEADAIRAALRLAKGETAASVAAAFGVSIPGIYATLRRYKIPSPAQLDPSVRAHKVWLSRKSMRTTRPRLTEDLAREAVALMTGNTPIANVARDLGLHLVTLRLGLKRYGLMSAVPPSARRPFKLTRNDAIAAAGLIAQGQSVASTARSLGVRFTTLRDALNRHGLRPVTRSKA